MSDSCENCAAPVEGDFCSRCGQSTTDYNVPVTELASDFVSETFSLDSRLRHTLKPLFFQPGEVPQQYVRGHRARFVPPVRLYIFASFAMFLLVARGPGMSADNISIGGGDGSTPDSTAITDAVTDSTTADGDGSFGSRVETFGRELERRLQAGQQRLDDDVGSFNRDFLNRLAQSGFFLLPAFAALLKLVYFKRLYVQHLVFAIYYHSFVFLIVALVAVAPALRLAALSEWMSLLLLTVPLYLLLGMKRFYEQSWWKTLAKFFFVSGSYFVLGTTTVLVLVFLVLLSI